MKNIIESKFTDADISAINAALTALENALAGKVGTLTEEERRRYGSVNEQNKLVVNKARDNHQTQPAMSAPDVDWTEFDSDYQARANIETWLNRLNAVKHDLESTKIMHDYDNFQDALKDYSWAQYKHGAGDDGYSTKVAEYKQLFTKSNKNNPPKDGGGEGGGGGVKNP